MLLLLLWVSTCRDFVCALRAESVFLHSLPGFPESKPCCLQSQMFHGLIFLGQDPRAEKLSVGLNLLLLEKHVCNSSCPLMFYLYKQIIYSSDLSSGSCLAVIVNCCLCSLLSGEWLLFSIHTIIFFFSIEVQRRKILLE